MGTICHLVHKDFKELNVKDNSFRAPMDMTLVTFVKDCGFNSPFVDSIFNWGVGHL